MAVIPPRPYWEGKRATIYLGDAREILPGLAKESVDCVATDPPYGVEWQSNTRTVAFDRIDGDGAAEALPLLAAVAPELVRVTRRTRHIYTFGLPVDHPLLPVKAELVWDKGRMGPGDLTCVWAPSHEPIFFHVRAADACNARKGSGALAARLRRSSVLSVPRLNATQVRRHPTEKPVALMRLIVESSTTPGEIVLDPFCGVGSTLVAAIASGRRAIGFELVEKYAEIAAERCQQAEALADKIEAA